MFEGKLFASKLPNSYAIGTPNGPDLVNGQALDVLLGGHWIAGRIRYSGDTLHVADIGGQHVGAYKQGYTSGDDTVIEASEESFPASDSPAWSSRVDQVASPATGVNTTAGYYFLADDDQSICGICVGMQIRIR
jgi:hypothetical protein